MPRKSQFQNLVLQQTLQDYTQQPTVVQPAITLPIKPEALVPLPSFSQALLLKPIAEATSPRTGELLPYGFDTRAENNTSTLSGTLLPPIVPPAHPRVRKTKQLVRGAALLLSVLLILIIYLTWHAATPTSASPTITQPAVSSFASTPSSQLISNATATSTTGNTDSAIQVYIVGAVKHPGVYTLSANARVYQLIQAAGGTQPDADLVSIDLAAKLTDGQEIYVLSVGETPPAYTNSTSSISTGNTPTTSSGTPVNINTATETQLEQGLHVSATTAKKIIAYRTQYGAYTSVAQLAQVVSKTIYDRIKSLVTV